MCDVILSYITIDPRHDPPSISNDLTHTSHDPHTVHSTHGPSHDPHTILTQLQTQHKTYNCYVTVQFSRSPQRGKLAERHEAGATAGGREEIDLGDAQVRLHLGTAKPRVLGGLACMHMHICMHISCHAMAAPQVFLWPLGHSHSRKP